MRQQIKYNDRWKINVLPTNLVYEKKFMQTYKK